MEQINANQSFDVSQIHMYYMNVITDLKVKFAEEKGYMQSQIHSLEKNIDSSNTKLEDARKEFEKVKSDLEIDKFLHESRANAIQKLLDVANKDISELQDELRKYKDKEIAGSAINKVSLETTKRKHDYYEYDNFTTKKNKSNKFEKKRILCFNFNTCTFQGCTYGHSVDELSLCPYGEHCDKRNCDFMFHSEENKQKFIQKNRQYDQFLCINYYKNGNCNDESCNFIHIYIPDHEF